MKFSPLFLLGCLALGPSACIKGKNADPVVPTPRQKVAGNWQLNAYTADTAFAGRDTVRTEAYSTLPACRKDDVFLFGTDGILLLEEGALTCNPAGGGTVVLGYWKLLENPSRLVMDDPDLPRSNDTLEIETLSDTVMTLRNNAAFTFEEPQPGAAQSGRAFLRKTYFLKK